jgi:hypothetical protein
MSFPDLHPGFLVQPDGRFGGFGRFGWGLLRFLVHDSLDVGRLDSEQLQIMVQLPPGQPDSRRERTLEHVVHGFLRHAELQSQHHRGLARLAAADDLLVFFGSEFAAAVFLHGLK